MDKVRATSLEKGLARTSIYFHQGSHGASVLPTRSYTVERSRFPHLDCGCIGRKCLTDEGGRGIAKSPGVNIVHVECVILEVLPDLLVWRWIHGGHREGNKRFNTRVYLNVLVEHSRKHCRSKPIRPCSSTEQYMTLCSEMNGTVEQYFSYQVCRRRQTRPRHAKSQE